jgi:ABC-2 type transport system permease protein
MGKLVRSFIRMSAFLRKEIFEILRQPRLVFTLVLGPFLILLLFGIGYQAIAPPLRTLFVVHQGSPLEEQIEDYAGGLGPQLEFLGVTYDGPAALDLLNRGQVDIVAVAPGDALERIRNNEPATFTLYHREIDPFQIDYIEYFGQVYVDEVNRRVLREITVAGQQDAAGLTEEIRSARTSAANLRTALQAGDEFAARQEQLELDRRLDAVSLVVGASLGLLSGVEDTVGGEETEADEMITLLSQLRDDTDQLDPNAAEPTQLERMERIENNLESLEENLSEFQRIDARVLVSPFRSETQTIAPIQPTPPEFFAPAVLALLLQHLAITFAALSIVRERSVGTMELFRVSPLSSGETLLGKYLSYMIFGGIIAAILTLLMIFILRLPMLGMWENFIIIVALMLFTSLSIGFVISIISQTDTQAVQYTMIILIASVFFSGFLMQLEMLWEPVRIVSWLLPTTYGIILLRDVMLLGVAPDLILLAGLAGIGLVLLFFAWITLRRLISRSRR